MLRYKRDVVDILNTVEGTAVTLVGLSGVRRNVKAVRCEMADNLIVRVWKNQDKIAEVNSSQIIDLYGSATVFSARLPMDCELKEGDELKLNYLNSTGGNLTDVNGVIEYDEG